MTAFKSIRRLLSDMNNENEKNCLAKTRNFSKHSVVGSFLLLYSQLSHYNSKAGWRPRFIPGEFLRLSAEESTSEEEDEDGALLTPQVEKKLLKVLSLIKRKDPKIYNPSNVFFNDSDFEPEDQEEEKEVRLSVREDLHVGRMSIFKYLSFRLPLYVYVCVHAYIFYPRHPRYRYVYICVSSCTSSVGN